MFSYIKIKQNKIYKEKEKLYIFYFINIFFLTHISVLFFVIFIELTY